jgi:hypothetical protein
LPPRGIHLAEAADQNGEEYKPEKKKKKKRRRKPNSVIFHLN